MTTEPTHSRSGRPRADRVRAVRRGARLPAGLRAVLGRGGVLRARDGPPPAGLRRGAATGPSPFADIPRRFVGLVQYAFVQSRMFRDVRAGLMHAGIFWGFILLTIGTANIVTGGLIESVLSIPFDGLLWAAVSAMQNVVAVIVLVCIAWAFWRRLVTKPARLTFNRDALIILGMIGGVVATELLAEAFEFARYGDQPGAFVSTALAVPLRATFSESALEAGFAVLWWAHMLLVAAFLAYLPFSKHLHIATAFPNIWFRKLRPRGELPRSTSRTRPRRSAADAPGPRLEGPARRLHVHRMRPLPAGLPGLEHRQAAQPQDVHHGHPGHVGRGRARGGPHPELADRARHVRARRHAAERRGARPTDRRHRDPVRRRVGLRHLRRVRRGLPRAHRARRQDRRAAPEPGPRGLDVPAGADDRDARMEAGQPVGSAGVGPARLDEAAAVRRADGGGGPVGRGARRAGGPVLGRLRGRLRPAEPEGGPGGGDLPPCRGCLVRGARPGGVVHGRPGAPDGQRLRVPDPRLRGTSTRSTGTGWGSGRS